MAMMDGFDARKPCPECGTPREPGPPRPIPEDADRARFCATCGAEIVPRRISDRLRSLADEPKREPEPAPRKPEGIVIPGELSRRSRVPSDAGPLPHIAAHPTATDVIKQLLEGGDDDTPRPEPHTLIGRVRILQRLARGGLSGEDLVRAAGLLRNAFGLVLLAVPSSEAESVVFSEIESVAEPSGSACQTVDDLDSARHAVQESIRGRLVFALLHALDATEAIVKLDDEFRIDRVLAANSLRGVIAERAVRAICEHCRVPAEPEPSERERLRLPDGPVFRGAGCERCDYTGYAGSAGIFETFSITRSIRDMLGRGESGDAVRRVALWGGELRTFREAGIAAVRAGMTTTAELVRALAS